MIKHRKLTVEQRQDERDGSAVYVITCADCGWYVTVGGFFGAGKDCPEG